MTFRLHIPFAPVAKQRARATWTNQGMRHYTPDATREWEETVAIMGRNAMAGREPMAGALEVHLQFLLPIPASWPKWKRDLADGAAVGHTIKPDLDNLEKAVMDGLNGIAWVDDAQVVKVIKAKHYSATPGVRIDAAEFHHLLPAQVSRRPSA